MTKTEIIQSLKSRILSEHKKHDWWSENDEWAELAARKIFNTWDIKKMRPAKQIKNSPVIVPILKEIKKNKK